MFTNKLSTGGAVTNSFGNTISGGDFQGATGYLGVKFAIGANTHYGWVQLFSFSDATTITIFDFTYESIPDKEIVAGKFSTVNIEERNTEASVYNFNRNIHITALHNGLAIVYNKAGKEVARKSLQKGNQK